MGNDSNQRSSSNTQSTKVSNSYQSSNTDSRSYSNTDSRAYSNTDSRAYSNVDSRDMSTNVNNVDNKNVSETALDCGVNPSDVENYTNDESININQDNSQNIVVTGDGNTLENVSQKMNLTSYGPKVQKCMQDAVTKMASASKTSLSDSSANSTSSSSANSNETKQTSANSNSVENDLSTSQKSSNKQSSSQSTKQAASSSQTAGFGSGNGGSDYIIMITILGVIMYINQDNTINIVNLFKKELTTNKILQLLIISYTFIILFKKYY
jgi:hypothetical protein